MSLDTNSVGSFTNHAVTVSKLDGPFVDALRATAAQSPWAIFFNNYFVTIQYHERTQQRNRRFMCASRYFEQTCTFIKNAKKWLHYTNVLEEFHQLPLSDWHVRVGTECICSGMLSFNRPINWSSGQAKSQPAQSTNAAVQVNTNTTLGTHQYIINCHGNDRDVNVN